MGILSKRQYEYRRESAAMRDQANALIAINNGLTEAQTDLLSELCSARHEMHCNIDRLVNDGTYNGIANRLLNASHGLEQLHLGCPQGLDDDYIDIDDINVLYEVEDIPTDDDEREEYLSSQRDRIYLDWHTLNNDIERYLRDIDSAYGTHYEPTGALRL